MVRRWASQLGKPSPARVCGPEETERINGKTVKSLRVGRVADRVVVPIEGEGQHNPARGKDPYGIGA